MRHAPYERMMMDKRKPIPSMVRRAIFQEANSRCALCNNSDIAALDTHHIDAIKDAGMNSPENLIVLCANCHRKVTHGSISRDELSAAKNGLQSARATGNRNDCQAGNVVHIQGNVEGSIVANTVRLATKRLPRSKYPDGCVGQICRSAITFLI